MRATGNCRPALEELVWGFFLSPPWLATTALPVLDFPLVKFSRRLNYLLARGSHTLFLCQAAWEWVRCSLEVELTYHCDIVQRRWLWLCASLRACWFNTIKGCSRDERVHAHVVGTRCDRLSWVTWVNVGHEGDGDGQAQVKSQYILLLPFSLIVHAGASRSFVLKAMAAATPSRPPIASPMPSISTSASPLAPSSDQVSAQLLRRRNCIYLIYAWARWSCCMSCVIQLPCIITHASTSHR